MASCQGAAIVLDATGDHSSAEHKRDLDELATHPFTGSAEGGLIG